MTDFSTVPDLIIAGAPKSGTSSLFEWLRLHPQVVGSTRKETQFLSDTPEPDAVSFQRDGLAAYGTFFRPAQSEAMGETVFLEATPDYIYQHTPLDVLARQLPATNVIVILRQPAKRVWSAFNYARNNLGVIPADQDFSGFLETTFGQEVLAQSHYAQYLESWQVQLGGRIRVLLFERLIADPRAALADLSEWLGIDVHFWKSAELNARNTTLQLRSRGVHELGLKVAQFLPAGWVNRLMPAYQRWNATSASKMTQEDVRVLTELDETFAADKAFLESRFGLNLSVWSTVNGEMNKNNSGPQVKTS